MTDDTSNAGQVMRDGLIQQDPNGRVARFESAIERLKEAKGEAKPEQVEALERKASGITSDEFDGAVASLIGDPLVKRFPTAAQFDAHLARSTGEAGHSNPKGMVLRAAEDCELFSDFEGEAYATFPVGDHRETAKIDSSTFKTWLRGQVYRGHRVSVPGQTLQDCVETLVGRALHDESSGRQEVFVRTGWHDGRIYIDLGNGDWECVEISQDGWRVVPEAPVRFVRGKHMKAMAKPEAGGFVSELRPLMNVASDEDWALFVGYLAMALRPSGPYPVLVLTGEQGSAKSTFAKVVKRLIDPARAELQSEPKDVRDLMVKAENGWVLAYDNISRLQPWLSDAFCRLATGGGFSTRKLFDNKEETVFDATRPLVLNGIEDFATKSDLLDRAAHVHLPTIGDSDRMTEDAFWKRFDVVSGRVLGALFEAMATALRRFDEVSISALPRMADFAQWVVAAEPSLDIKPGLFMWAYTRNRSEGHALAVEDSPVGLLLIKIAEEGGLEGTASDLLKRMGELTPDSEKRLLPASNKLRGQIQRIAPNLRALGVIVDLDLPKSERGKLIRVRARDGDGTVRSVSIVDAGSKPREDTDDTRHRADDTGASDRQDVLGFVEPIQPGPDDSDDPDDSSGVLVTGVLAPDVEVVRP